MPFEDGPYIQAAAFCEQILEDKTGVLSLIRVIDRLTHTAAGTEAPEEMPPIPWHMKLVLMLKSGRAKGRHEVKIVPERPSGEQMTPIILTAQFEGEERGNNFITDVNIIFTMEGLYWFLVYLDNVLFTKLPFSVQYRRIVTGGR